MTNRKIFKSKERLRYGYFQFMDHFFGRDRVFSWHNKSRRKHFSELHKRLKDARLEGEIKPIERRKNIGVKELKRNYIAKGRPVVIEGGAKDWNCVKTWSIDFFRERYGHEEILLVDHTAIESEYEMPTLGDVLGGPGEDVRKYCRFYPLLQRHPEHIKDFDYDWLLKCRHRLTYDDEFEIFIGGKKSYTPLHNAFSGNLFVQAYGEKEWTIYSPYYSMIFDPDPAENVYRATSSRQGSMFNPFLPDYDAHPLFKYVDGLKVHLKPGDIFFNPPFWWHSVENPTDSIGVGYRWFAPFYSFQIAPLYFTLDLFARNPSIWKCLRLIETDTNLIQLAQAGRLDEFLERERTKEVSFYK